MTESGQSVISLLTLFFHNNNSGQPTTHPPTGDGRRRRGTAISFGRGRQHCGDGYTGSRRFRPPAGRRTRHPSTRATDQPASDYTRSQFRRDRRPVFTFSSRALVRVRTPYRRTVSSAPCSRDRGGWVRGMR